MPKNKVAETLRNYAKRDDLDVVFRCILSEAAATIESLAAERDNLYKEVHILHQKEGTGC